MSSPYQGSKVLITGAAGFIGSHLTDTLLSLGAEVLGVDNFITGRRENIAHLDGNDAFNLIEADASHPPVSYLPDEYVPEYVFHLASPASPPRYQAKPIETYLVCSMGTHHLLQLLLERNPQATFVYASTSEVYGDPLEHPQKESYWGNVNPNGPRSCYDEAKRMGETICGVHQREFGMDVRIVRIFNTYGPRMDPEDGRVIPNLSLQALKNVPFTIYGDGTQTRSYCFVDDLVAGFEAMGSVAAARNQTINLGNPGEFTINETLAVLKDLTGSTESVTHHPLPPDDPTRRQPDITKAKEILGWEPTVSLQDGMKLTLPYFKQFLE
ncbi:MAG: NAD-dependent epimerase/dehydratase family protein [Patescibacteria group bacterium]